MRIPWLLLIAPVLTSVAFAVCVDTDMEALVRQTVPPPSNWGWFRPDGQTILIKTFTLFCGFVLASVLALRHIRRQLALSSRVFFLVSLALLPMLLATTESVACQLTSGHYQGHIHRRAIMIIGFSAVAILVAGAIVDGLCVLKTLGKGFSRQEPDTNILSLSKPTPGKTGSGTCFEEDERR